MLEDYSTWKWKRENNFFSFYRLGWIGMYTIQFSLCNLTLFIREIYFLCSLWYKTGCFQMSFFLCKSTARSLPTRYVSAINETFQMRYCMKFNFKRQYFYGGRVTLSTQEFCQWFFTSWMKFSNFVNGTFAPSNPYSTFVNLPNSWIGKLSTMLSSLKL